MSDTLTVDDRVDRRYITIGQTAEYLSLSYRTVQDMIRDGRLRAYANGSRVIRLRLDEVDASMVPLGGDAA
jgi:excisionase family DNA binding protein